MSKHSEYWIRRWLGKPPRIDLPELCVRFRVGVRGSDAQVHIDRVNWNMIPVLHQVTSERRYLHHKVAGVHCHEGINPRYLKDARLTTSTFNYDYKSLRETLIERTDSIIEPGQLDGRRKWVYGTCGIVLSVCDSESNTWSDLDAVYTIFGSIQRSVQLMVITCEEVVREVIPNVLVIGTLLRS